MSAPPDPDLTIAKIIKRKLDQARDQLIDRNLRNRLVNCPLTSKRSKQVRVVDELPDQVFNSLLAQKKELTFAAGRGPDVEDADEADPDHGVWTPPEDEVVDEAGVAKRHRDNVLQTLLTSEGLQKRLTSLYYESREVEQEQGVNVLYLALGFLKWFEDGRSEVERYAPLVLVPIELTREGARDKFKVKARDEDMYTNMSLKIWLAEQHSIQLPELPDADDWIPSEYFDQVRKVITKSERWEILDNEILLGFFSFSKFLLWRDLDPANWPTPESLLGHKVLRTLLAPHEENPIPDPPVVPDDRRVDDVFKASELVYVLDADSSQTMAIQTALAGRNLVIQGPPGTGKSQTIANIIAAAIHQGKSVLFVAEKLAALEVVFQRLKDVDLAPLCLELHSRRASKMQVLAQIRIAMDAPAPAGAPGTLCQDLDEHGSFLSAHVDRLHAKHAPGGHTAFAILGTICALRDKGVVIPDFEVKGAEAWTRAEIDRVRTELDQFAERLAISGVPAKHPWRGSERETVNPLDAQRLTDLCGRLASSVEATSPRL